MYIDFDNFFGGLIAADPEAAVEVAMNPAIWLAQLTHLHSHEGGRRWLALRCYMNPAGWVANPRVEGERLYFSRFRPYFVRAGFEVVDCPTLARGKNAGDIRIVIDVMTALQGPARIEEFVLASSDADFTPLLHVVRAHDRLVTMIATGETAMAYEALADRVLDAQVMVDLVAPDVDEPETTDDPGIMTHPAPSELDALKDAFAAGVMAQYDSATEPLNLATAASRLVSQLGTELRASDWLGAGSFLRAVHALNLPNVAFSQHYMWDTSRHTPPGAAIQGNGLPPAVERLAQVTGLPRIPSEDWPRAFAYLEEYARTQQFSLTESSKWPRDRSAESGHLIARGVFLYIVTSSHRHGTRLDVDPRPTAKQIGLAVLGSVLTRAEIAGIEVSHEDEHVVRAWLGLDPADDRPGVDTAELPATMG